MNFYTDSELKEEIYKCSKCGLCKSVCPLYLLTKNEMYSPRGRFILLNNILSNNLRPSKSFIKNLDFCLNCNLCKDFCPSNIDTVKILTSLKNKYKYKYSFLSFHFIYFLYLNLLRIFKLFYFVFPFKNEYLNKLFTVNVKRKSFSEKKSETVLLFEGCFNKYINPSDKNAASNIIEAMGFNVKCIHNCCGYPYLSDGNIDLYKKNIEKIADFIKNKDYKYIVCTCDSCYNNLLNASEYCSFDKSLFKNLITFDKFLELNNYQTPDCSKIKYFKPLIRKISLNSDKNFEIVNQKGTCSLMENFLMFKYSKALKNISKNSCRTLDFLSDKIVTTCQITKWGIIKELSNINMTNNVMSYAEFIENELENKKHID